MWFQVLVQEDVEAKDFEADVSIFITPLVTASDLRLVRYARLDNHVLYSVHYFLEVYTISAHPLLQLEKIPLGGILLVVAIASGATFNVVISALVYGVVRQMNESFL